MAQVNVTESLGRSRQRKRDEDERYKKKIGGKWYWSDYTVVGVLSGVVHIYSSETRRIARYTLDTRLSYSTFPPIRDTCAVCKTQCSIYVRKRTQHALKLLAIGIQMIGRLHRRTHWAAWAGQCLSVFFCIPLVA